MSHPVIFQQNLYVIKHLFTNKVQFKIFLINLLINLSLLDFHI